MVDVVYKNESYATVGACFEVYNVMGSGFLESVYQECLGLEFGQRRIPFRAQESVSLRFKDQRLKCRYVPDFICFDRIIVEIKAAKELTEQHRAQVHNYLKATGMKLGLLVNFGSHPNLEVERIVR